jgi:hypothetical protein
LEKYHDVEIGGVPQLPPASFFSKSKAWILIDLVLPQEWRDHTVLQKLLHFMPFPAI